MNNGQLWLNLWSFGRFNLGLSDEEFWHLTLAQFNALAKRYDEQQERQDYRAALICTVLAEINRDRKKRPRPFKPEDFMPKRGRKQKPMTDEQMLAQAKIITAALGGKVE